GWSSAAVTTIGSTSRVGMRCAARAIGPATASKRRFGRYQPVARIPKQRMAHRSQSSACAGPSSTTAGWERRSTTPSWAVALPSLPRRRRVGSVSHSRSTPVTSMSPCAGGSPSPARRRSAPGMAARSMRSSRNNRSSRETDMRGRRPKPTRLKMLTGNPGKRPLNADEPRPEPVIPECPPELGPVARKEWDRLATELASLKILTALDRAALAAYCNAYGLWAEATEAIQKYGTMVKSPSGYPIQSPYVSIANRQAEIMMRIASEFGFTPVSRSRIATSARPEPDLFSLLTTTDDEKTSE